jgi:hypothetical protein
VLRSRTASADLRPAVEKKRILSALVLIYTGVDVMASLQRSGNEGVGEAFIRWVDNYLLKARTLPCTALELFAARCGVLHTFTADSDLFRKGEVRQVLYAWGTAKASDLAASISKLDRDDGVAIQVEDLFWAFREGLATYVDAVDQSPTLRDRFAQGTDLWFTDVSLATMEQFLNQSR